jgi:predicted TIM-barrel fold metal-dependent hydrolase
MAGELLRPPPAYRNDPAARIKVLDEQGVDQVFIYPTLANLVERGVKADPDLVHALIHSLNEWILETWSFDYQERIFVTPVITLGVVEKAVDELEWLLDRGARAVLIQPAPPEGYRGHRSFGLAEFDPFWARLEQAGIPLCIHSALSIVEDYVALWEPSSSTNAFTQSAFKRVAQGHRDIEDALTALICHGTFSRFPGLRVATVENGTEWVPFLMERLDRAYRQTPTLFAEPPLDVMRRNIFFHPFWEENLRRLVDHVGIDRVIFGSDFPHPEGLAEPRDYFNYLEGFSDEEVSRIVHDNAAELLG